MDLTIVLKPGPARRVDPGLGRPGPGTGPGLGKNPSGSWPGKPGRTAGSTRNPDDPGKPGRDPASFFIYIHGRETTSFWALIFYFYSFSETKLIFYFYIFSETKLRISNKAENFKVNQETFKYQSFNKKISSYQQKKNL
jgi:hypothetical protein